MSTGNPIEAPSNGLKPVIRARVDDDLKERVAKACEKMDRSEAWFLRQAVIRFLDAQEAQTEGNGK